MIRVLHVINGEHYSGAERVQDLLSQRLPALGFQVDFVLLKPGRFEKCRQFGEARLFQLPMQSRFDLSVASELRQIMRGGRYALVHTHTPRAALLTSLTTTGLDLPFVHHVHSPTSRDTEKPLRNLANAFIERMTAARARALIAVSNSLGNYLVSQGYRKDRIVVVHNGVPKVPEHRIWEPPEALWTIGTVALFRPRKGLEYLLEAFSQLVSSFPGMELRLRAVGPFETPEYEVHIKSLTARLGIAKRVDWIGFATDVRSELEEMDVFVLPSLFGEGLPMVVLEAMASGVAIVGTAVEGVPEAIRDGVDGLLAVPGDDASLVEKLSAILTGRANAMDLIHSAYARHGEMFSDMAMARSVATVYQHVLNGSSGR